MTMKKITCLLALSLFFASNVYSQGTGDMTSVEKSGWLVYCLGHAIWFENKLQNKVEDKAFFASGGNYKNGLIVDDNSKAKAFKSFSKCYAVKSLTNIDTVTKKGEYTYPEKICIVPVKVKVIMKPGTEPLDQAGISFKKDSNEVTLEYWFLTDYSVTQVELLRTANKKKVKR